MEPLVCSILCPNCSETQLAFKDARPTRCEGCSFDAEVFTDRVSAFAAYERFLSDADVIVADPARMGSQRWVVAHTRLMLV